MTTNDKPAQRLQRAIGLLVRRFQLAERADVQCCGMTVAQAATLEVLSREGPLRLGTLGGRLGITASTLSRNLARLEERGLVRRRPDPADRRALEAELTADGIAAAEDVGCQEAAFAEAILARIGEDRAESVVASLEELVRAVGEATGSCCPDAFVHLMSEKKRRES